MVELGELEKRQTDFAERKVRIVAISNDSLEDAKATQADFPHLTIVSDAEQNVARAVQVLHKGAHPEGGDANAPTTFLLDAAGELRWMFRPERVFVRLSPDELLKAINANLRTR